MKGTHRRNVQGSAARAAELGAGDGLITNASPVLGVAGAGTSAGDIRLAGMAGLVAGARRTRFCRGQGELTRHEIDVERQELTNDCAG